MEGYHQDVPDNFEIPRSYVRYHRATPQELELALEYVADAEDETWLRGNTKFGGACDAAKPQLTLALMEQMIDLLEKATGFEAIITTSQAETLFLNRLPQIFHIFPNKPQLGVVTTKHVIHDVYNYWMQKRSKLKRPLLRRFWPLTSTDDTNPHLVFRPREKEKYKLRKKRQNDYEAYRKLKQLRSDFDNLRAILQLIKHRETLARAQVYAQVELFEQRLYDITDTSNTPRPCPVLSRNELMRAYDVPVLFDVNYGGRTLQRSRALDASSTNNTMTSPMDAARSSANMNAIDNNKINIAGRQHGEPAPNFLQPLSTRERYATDPPLAPYLPTYEDSHVGPTFVMRRWPRVGRGGRVVIDRVPQPLHDKIPPLTVLTAGRGLARYTKPKDRLLDLLPEPLDRDGLSRKIEEMCVAAIQEDFDARHDEENDGDEVLVRLEDWLNTDDQLWGEERFQLGPL